MRKYKISQRSFIVLLITICTCFLACSPQKKLAHLLKKHPELVITSTKSDTILTPIFKHDTTFKFSPGTIDTFIIENEKFTTKIVRSHDTIKVYTTLPPDTLIINTTTQEVKNIVRPLEWYKFLGIAIIALLIVALIIELIRTAIKFFNPLK